MQNACEFLADVGYEFLLSRCEQGRIVQDLIDAKVTPWPNRSGCKWIIPITWPDRVPGLVTWTGQMTLPKIINGMIDALKKAKDVEDIRAFQAPMTGATGFDLRTAIEPLDAGFSLDKLGMPIMRRVGLELLGIIGLQTLPLVSLGGRKAGVIYRGKMYQFPVLPRSGGYYHKWGNVTEMEIEEYIPPGLIDEDEIEPVAESVG
ncbi:hypothetical protein Plim_4299 (plasmid) [Planctopirus limnophila DSM 3776]|uniref:Uncharacterized protein n=1 Tax=Planctopirus limnophila (strain ATCC 43296 / DSM 3776 / IFAM 1008 / Mu 290) TaxID=521674 RepID=D5SZI6_PLAL2|nr:hypothetical protein [Planctopirus limnophila]ADG70106.1 hypothetical protein Plim_4299 [Planctopirus limnophila DSM 3776]